MKFKLEIELGNDAMQNAGDIAQALIETAKWLQLDPGAKPAQGDRRSLCDINGNRVGAWRVTR